jgi:tubulin polyglutamylase TTLL11
MLYSPADLVGLKSAYGEDNEKVVQRYLRKPLLFNGLKHDLRLYLLIANVDPLVAFLNEEGLARFCTTPYEMPTHETKNRDKNVHLTNFSLNKASPNFKHTDELLEENEGSKQTLSSYWKALEKRGMDVKKIKSEIIKLNQNLLKSMKPFLMYFQKCIFPRSEPGKYFHVIGVDIILDSKCHPWILEINSSPSLSIDSTIKQEISSNPMIVTNNPLKHKLNEPKSKYTVSNVDLHVKSMALGHAVKLCKKSVDKIEDYEEYDSYTQIYGPDVEEELFAENSVYDHIYNLFVDLSGPRFFPALTPVKFCRISKVLKDVGTKTLNKVELEICFKKTLEHHEQMDFYAFIDCIELLCSKIYPPETPLRDAMEGICKNYSSMKKPLFYF